MVTKEPPHFCRNCLETVTVLPSEHMAVCPKQLKFVDENGYPELLPMTEPGDEPPF